MRVERVAGSARDRSRKSRPVVGGESSSSRSIIACASAPAAVLLGEALGVGAVLAHARRARVELERAPHDLDVGRVRELSRARPRSGACRCSTRGRRCRTRCRHATSCGDRTQRCDDWPCAGLESLLSSRPAGRTVTDQTKSPADRPASTVRPSRITAIGLAVTDPESRTCTADPARSPRFASWHLSSERQPQPMHSPRPKRSAGAPRCERRASRSTRSRCGPSPCASVARSGGSLASSAAMSSSESPIFCANTMNAIRRSTPRW